MDQPGTFYHLTDEHSSLVMHNARLGHGVLFSVSMLAQVPGWEDMTTPYAALNLHQTKEAVWEQVRWATFPALPSRLKSFYCFQGAEDAERARIEWFGNAPKKLLELRIGEGSASARLDTNWLNCVEGQWEVNASSYRSGAKTARFI